LLFACPAPRRVATRSRAQRRPPIPIPIPIQARFHSINRSSTEWSTYLFLPLESGTEYTSFPSLSVLIPSANTGLEPSAPAQNVTACKKCQCNADSLSPGLDRQVHVLSQSLFCLAAQHFIVRAGRPGQPEFNPPTRLPSVPTTTYFQTASLLLPRNVGPTRSGAHLHQRKCHGYAGPARSTRAWTIILF
jgi:hypothetical protein